MYRVFLKFRTPHLNGKWVEIMKNWRNTVQWIRGGPILLKKFGPWGARGVIREGNFKTSIGNVWFIPENVSSKQWIQCKKFFSTMIIERNTEMKNLQWKITTKRKLTPERFQRLSMLLFRYGFYKECKVIKNAFNTDVPKIFIYGRLI